MADALHLFQAGGWMMYPLVLCSIVVVAIAVERFRFYGAHTARTLRIIKSSTRRSRRISGGATWRG